MEIWATVVIAFIVALSTLSATIIQNRYSAKRFEKELKSARETDHRHRKREVRSEPLLKLGAELALMAAKRDRLLAARHRRLVPANKRTPLDMTEEEATIELQEAENDWNDYRASGDLAQTLFLQYDRELVNKVEKIRKDSWSSFLGASIKAKVIEVQELINKRLEEL